MDKDTILNYVTETPGNTNRAVLGSMLDSLGEKLPAVTVEDNGKVLTVIEGAWDKAETSGSNVAVVTFYATGSNDNYTITSASHSVDEVRTLISTDANIYAKLSVYDTGQQMTDVRISSNITYLMYNDMVIESNFYFTGYTMFRVKSKVDETGWDLSTLT